MPANNREMPKSLEILGFGTPGFLRTVNLLWLKSWILAPLEKSISHTVIKLVVDNTEAIGDELQKDYVV